MQIYFAIFFLMETVTEQQVKLDMYTRISEANVKDFDFKRHKEIFGNKFNDHNM